MPDQMLDQYLLDALERKENGLPPRPLHADEVAELVEWMKAPPGEKAFREILQRQLPKDVNLDDFLQLFLPPQGGQANPLLDNWVREGAGGKAGGKVENFLRALLTCWVPAGVDQAAYVKAGFLAAVTRGEAASPLLDASVATELLGTMLGGYNIEPLIALLEHPELAPIAAARLGDTLLMFDAFHDVREKSGDNPHAMRVLQSWADAEWFTKRAQVPEAITVTVFRVDGEINTDDMSPAQAAWNRPDIPDHAKVWMQRRLARPLPEILAELRQKGHPLAFVGDVVGTGSSRKSATNSLLWHLGEDIPFIPNKRGGGHVLGGKIAPIFFNTLEDAGTLPIECDVRGLKMGDVITLHPHEGRISDQAGKTLNEFELDSPMLLDEVRAGGRIPLIIGRGLTARAREALALPPSEVFRKPSTPDGQAEGRGYTLAQKMVGRACGLPGVRPGAYCEPKMTTVGSQDTTGPMTRDELKELACLGFSADLVMQSFCHTAAYPKPTDIETQHTLPDFIQTRGGVALRPGDGIIHSWLNRMLLPDTVGTGADSHTRFPLGISFPGGSGLVAFAAALGVMPLNMPESVLVRFKGKMQPGITLRDLVNAIPYAAIQQGLLTVDRTGSGKKNIFNGRILEIEGLPWLKAEQAFELSDASAERSAGGCTILLDKAPIEEYLNSNVTLLKWMLANNYGDIRTLERRIQAMEAWLAAPQLLRPDPDADYAATIEIDLNEIREPLLACPNDPDDVRPLSEVAGDRIDEVFIGSCMTNIGHFRAAARLLDKAESVPTRLWVSPPTRMDEHQLRQEGIYNVFAKAGARTELPGCSLCMGNQARVMPDSTVVSTSTRNFPNRLGDGANVYLASAELAAVAAVLGRLPTLEEYLGHAADLDHFSADIYIYLNFDQLNEYRRQADEVGRIPATSIEVLEPAS